MYAARSEHCIRISDCFLHRESIKTIPGRAYDEQTKTWTVPLLAENAAKLRLLGAVLSEELQDLFPEDTTDAGPVEPVCPMPFKGDRLQHQIRAFNFAMHMFEQGKGFALFADMGTGKTAMSIAIAGALFIKQRIRRVLVIAPKTIVPVWEEEYLSFADYPYTFAVLGGSSYQKSDTLRHLDGNALQIAGVNYESAWRMEADILRWDPDMVICDESTKIKNPQAKQSKALHRIGKKSRLTMALTGTPADSPLDFFSQYKFLDDRIFGASFYSFRNRYAIMGGYGNYQVIGYRHMEELLAKVHSIAYRIKLEDAVELPPTIDEYRNMQLERSAQTIYNSIDRDSYAKLISGEITTQNVLTRLLRLSQCTGGFIRDDEDGIVQKVSGAKLDALEDIVDICMEEGKKVVVFARFVPEIEAIAKMLQRLKVQYSLIKGDVKDRAEQITRFQTDPECRVFVGQLQTTGMGLTLTAASVAVYYSQDFSYQNYKQSRARIHRISQKRKCLYIHLVAKGTVDEKIIDALKHKGDVAKLMVDEYRALLKEEPNHGNQTAGTLGPAETAPR